MKAIKPEYMDTIQDLESYLLFEELELKSNSEVVKELKVRYELLEDRLQESTRILTGLQKINPGDIAKNLKALSRCT